MIPFQLYRCSYYIYMYVCIENGLQDYISKYNRSYFWVMYLFITCKKKKKPNIFK